MSDSSITEDPKQQYDNTLRLLSDFLQQGLGINKIEVHQIYFLLMYFPFYMVSRDLQDKYKIAVNFTNEKDENNALYENDDAIISKMIDPKFEALDTGNTENKLQLALCEPVIFNKRAENIDKFKPFYLNKEKGTLSDLALQSEATGIKEPNTEGSYFIHLPFINFPPLYGISLVNNPSINQIKRKRMNTEMKTVKDEEGTKSLVSLLSYWRHFSSKLSLLQKSHFEDLTASLYPQESTTDWLIRGDLKFKFHGVSWIKLEKEFEDLFHKHVDVAFTIQPWMAVVASEKHELPLDIEIVYKNRCIIDYDCTSIIFKTNKEENLLLGDFILRCFYQLIQFKIRELYDGEDSKIEDEIVAYCDLRSQYCKFDNDNGECGCECCKCGNNSSDGKKDHTDGCLFENKMALQILNDSQIYRHRDKNIKVKVSKEDPNQEAARAAGAYFSKKFGETQVGLKEFEFLMESNNGRSETNKSNIV